MRRNVFLALTTAFVILATAPADQLTGVPAFPGAEGGAMYTPGGRGGKVVEVTNLNDNGPGSLRVAVTTPGPRTVVFRVAGIITLQSPLKINQPFVTIAGQTAPGDGICVRGATTDINTHDVVIRYMRFRRGESPVRNDGLGGNPEGNVMVDHVSASWGLDENLSLYRYMKPLPNRTEQKLPAQKITIQWTISSEALNPNNHAFGGTWGGVDSSFHHNLFASNTGRNPSIGMGWLFDYRNNVIFNWKHRTMDGGDGSSTVNAINNYYKPGPATNPGPLQYRIAKADRRSGPGPFGGMGKWFVAGNFVEGHPKVTADNWSGGVQYDGERKDKETIIPEGNEQDARVNSPFPAPRVTTHTAEEAYELVLAYGGAILPVRDPVDVRVIESVRTGKPTFKDGIINSPADVGGYPEYKSAPAPVDTDHDGMPDEWERKHGLSPIDAADGAADKDNDGYTNLEEFLNATDPAQFVDYRQSANNVNPHHKPLAVKK